MIFPIEQIQIPNGKMDYYAGFMSKAESIKYFNIFHETLEWRQDEIKMFGKIHKVPRLQAWYGNEGMNYAYSGIKLKALKWTKELQEVRIKIEKHTSFKFNSVLINLYRDGADSNGWHADNEPELGLNPKIASISLGAERTFHFKHRKMRTEKGKILLSNGSLLCMHGEMQHHWLHQISKTKKTIGPRINLTFRNIIL